MTRLSERLIGDAHVNGVAWPVLEELTAIGNRMSGQEGEREASQTIERWFRQVGGRDVRVDEFEIPGWWRGASSVTVDTPRERTFDGDHEIIALPGSPSGTVEAEVVDVGYGLPEDFEAVDLNGKVALASRWVPDDYGRWVHRQEKYAKAVAAGAEGFLFCDHRPGGTPPTGFVSFAGSTASIPAAGLSYETGRRLKRHAGDGMVANLSVDCRNEPTTSRNVQCVVGPDTEEEVVVCAHVDAHDIAEGAGDDGSGCAILVEVARLLAASDRLDTAVRLLGFGAEEAGMYGAEDWANSADLSRVKCVLNLDGIGDSRTLRVAYHEFRPLLDAFDAACDDLGVPYHAEADIMAHGDQWPFARRGVPAALIGSGDQGRVANAHTHLDTLDKIGRRDLRDLAVGVAGGVLTVAEAGRDLPSVPPDEVADRIDGETRTSLERQGRWPWDRVP